MHLLGFSRFELTRCSGCGIGLEQKEYATIWQDLVSTSMSEHQAQSPGVFSLIHTRLAGVYRANQRVTTRGYVITAGSLLGTTTFITAISISIIDFSHFYKIAASVTI